MSPDFPSPSRIQVQNFGDVSVIAFRDGRLLNSEIGFLMFEEVFQLANERGRRKLLLDLGNVQYWTRWLFGRLVPLYRKLVAVQGRLVLCNVARDLRDVFQLTKLDRIITIATGPESVGTEELVSELFGPTDREVTVDRSIIALVVLVPLIAATQLRT